MMKPAWYPDWSDERCVIVASGPSAGKVDLSSAKGRVKAIVINSSWRLAPWADILYACDAVWWDAHDGVPEFEGLRVGRVTEATLKRRIVTIDVQQKNRAADDEILLIPGVVAGGGSSGFQALNLAVQFGCKDIALVGFDARLDKGSHWHGDHGAGLTNPVDETIAIWRAAMDRAGPALRNLGFEVVNCSRESALRGFPKVDFQDWLAC